MLLQEDGCEDEFYEDKKKLKDEEDKNRMYEWREVSVDGDIYTLR